MDRQEILEAFDGIKVFARGERRAPHKPLLCLLMLGRIQRGKSRMVRFEDIRAKLTSLLTEFSPFSRSIKPEFPFWYLKNDGFWNLEFQRTPEFGGESPTANQLEHSGAKGGFTKEVHDLLSSNPDLLWEVADLITWNHFPESIHSDIYQATEVDDAFYLKKARKRDPNFRIETLRAYGYKCAVCGYDVRLDNQSIGLEAAHIKWHQAQGPDEVPNGMALCALHHKLFDRGAFTITDSGLLVVSNLINGSEGVQEWLRRFNKRPIHRPLAESDYPHPDFLSWHTAQVFRGKL